MANLIATLDELLTRRVLVLDGAMGTMIQRRGLTERDFRGTRFADHPNDLQGNNDLLVLTRPDVIADIHGEYLAAGADIVETNTFSGTVIAQADYGTEDAVYDLNKSAAQLAKEVAEQWSKKTPDKPRFVAGSIGPTNKTLSLSPKVTDPAFRAVTWEEMTAAFGTQIRGLLDGGADLLLAETFIDTLNLKACLFAMQAEFERRGSRVPVMLSVTITDKSGRILSGQTLEAFWASVAHAKPWSVGINCALGASEMRPYLVELGGVASSHISCYPNAGMPNAFGQYDEDPETTGRLVGEFAAAGLADVVGGCCGTTPAHIHQIAKSAEKARPRAIQVPDYASKPAALRLSGLEPLTVPPNSNFLVIGERTNVTGSKKFAELIRKQDFTTALQVALDQVRGGANILDVNMDDGMLDGVACMRTFLNLIASEPEIARIPIMVDSSKWEVLEAGLQCLQGKGIVNSISLKDGEAAFLAKARTILRYGASAVVMAFDEEGQADTTPRRVSICVRAYKLLTGIGFAPDDIIFDPNVLAIGTGLAEHNRYAVSFIESLREIKRLCPGARTSGGISNLSFSFRGNTAVREAMNSAFLYHAIGAGLDMGIVNAGQVVVYSDIDPLLLQHVEDVLFDRSPDATEKLVDFASTFAAQGKKKVEESAWRQGDFTQRIVHALVHGLVDHIVDDVKEAHEALKTPLRVIEGPMMDGMRVVGDLFGQGKMFLPQVVKSARVMKTGVAYLEPFLLAGGQDAQGQRQRSGKILMATVKGDVHDIGKNIVGVVLGCNDYEVVDLGVMVPCEQILRAAREHNVDAIGLSGLITPSLDEMVFVAKEMQRQGFAIPLLIGGATTSAQHTAVKIAQHYDGPVVHVLDASRAVSTVSSLLSKEHKDAFVASVRQDQQRLREVFALKQEKPPIPFAEAEARRPQLTYPSAPRPPVLGRQLELNIDLRQVVPYIDWTFFFLTWDLSGKFPQILEHPTHGQQARELYDHAQRLLHQLLDNQQIRGAAVWGIWPAQRQGNDVQLLRPSGDAVETTLHFLRQQRHKTDADAVQWSLADFVAPAEQGPDYLGAFAVTSGLGLEEVCAALEAQHDDYNAIMAKALADRLAEAMAEWLHQRVRKLWYAPEEQLDNDQLIAESYRGIRPAFGYPATPDHSEKTKLWALLQADEAGIHLTETLAMTPGASVSGLYFAHPESRYFALGRVGDDQLADYAARKGVDLETVKRWLGSTIAQ